MVVENIHIVQIHAFQALVQTGHQILSGPPIAIRSRPHIITSFCGNHHLIPVRRQLFMKNSSEILLCHSFRRSSIIISQIKMRDSMIERAGNDFLLLIQWIFKSKILPQSQRDLWKKQSALSATVVFHFQITIFCCLIHLFLLFISHYHTPIVYLMFARLHCNSHLIHIFGIPVRWVL